MMSDAASPSFVPTERTRLRRRPQRGSYDRAAVFAILDAAMLCHIGYVIDGAPYVTPTSFWRDGDRLYWHGSAASRMLRTQSKGIPVCLTVTHIDGLVIGRSGFHHSINYRSVMAFGRAEMIENSEEKRAALEAFIDRLYPGRNREIRPILAKELAATSVMGMTIEEASAKVRTGDPIDDDADYALDCWAGVIQLSQHIDAVVPDARLKPGIPLAPSLAPYRKGEALSAVLSSTVSGSKG